jgi:1-deoxy-D-xylulose-5-phosphate synthase
MGHASTSISAALGMAVARDIRGEHHSVVAVIGDGSLTGGLAFEALNNGGQLNSKVIVVLNDNRMSISPTAGAMSGLLNRLALSRGVESVENTAEKYLSVYRAGRELVNLGKRIKHGVKEFFLPASIWEELGFNYMGPYDGHNLEMLEAVLTRARDYQGKKPLFIHVITKKGKGYPPAEEDAVRFHGVARVCNPLPMEVLTFSDVFGLTMQRLMSDDPRIVAITAAMLEGTGLAEVKEAHPDRVFDVGICEEHATTFAAGLSAGGLLPVFCVYSTFLQRGFDQLIHDICLQDLPAVIAIDRAGIVGDDGKTHQGLFDLSYLGLIPNLRVAAPRDGRNLQNLLFTALKSGHPVAIRYPRANTAGFVCDEQFAPIKEGTAEILRIGSDITLLAVGQNALSAFEAGHLLEGYGIGATVIDARWVKPLDEEMILDAGRRTGRIVTIEENVISGGFGASVMHLCGSKLRNACIVLNLGIPDVFVEHASQDSLRRKFGLDAKSIVEVVLKSFPDLHVKAGMQNDVSNNSLGSRIASGK